MTADVGALPSAEVARRSRQRRRSVALAFALAFLVVLFYVVTILKMGGGA